MAETAGWGPRQPSGPHPRFGAVAGEFVTSTESAPPGTHIVNHRVVVGYPKNAIRASPRKGAAPRFSGGKPGLQNSVVDPADVVTGREGLFDDLQLMVHSGLEFEDDAAVANGLRLQNDVPLTATVDIGDRVTRVQILDGH
ncbi:hypothetical protein A3649_22400 [Mycobacterium ulcerans]|nr:hypothetical protein A3649_22400 [Mycobacterium ulcerans]